MRWLERILVAVDFSPQSEQALRYGARLAALYGARLEVLHVLARRGREPQWQMRQDVYHVLQRVIRLRKLVDAVCAGHGVLTGLVVRVGDPAAQILDQLKKQRFDLVVVCGVTSGQTPGLVLRRLLVGAPRRVVPVTAQTLLPAPGEGDRREGPLPTQPLP